MRNAVKTAIAFVLVLSLFTFSGCTTKKQQYLEVKELLKITEISEDSEVTPDMIPDGSEEDYNNALVILQDLSGYKNCDSIFYAVENKLKLDEAVSLFEEGEFSSAEEKFNDIAEITDVQRYLTAIKYMENYEGYWTSDSYNPHVSCSIEGPFAVEDYSEYYDCDWRVSANIILSVERYGDYGYQSFDISKKVSLDHLTDSPETKLSDRIMFDHEEYGQQVFNYMIGKHQDKGFSTISIEVTEDNNLELFEMLMSTDMTTVRGRNGLILKK